MADDPSRELVEIKLRVCLNAGRSATGKARPSKRARIVGYPAPGALGPKSRGGLNFDALGIIIAAQE